MSRPRIVLYGLLAVVATAAAVLSFAALAQLGRACGFGGLAPLLPIVIDAGAAAGSVAWLAGGPVRARRFGRLLALGLLVASIGGNAAAHYLHAYQLAAPWWGVVGVSALAPAVLAAVVHLAQVTAQTVSAPPETAAEPSPPSAGVAGTPDDRPAGDMVGVLISEGAGRRRIARELGVTEHRARQLLDAHTVNGAGR